VSGNAFANLAQSARFYPAVLDLERRAVLLLEMTRAGYQASSFLDERIVAAGVPGQWTALEDIERLVAAPAPPHPLHFIFHSGHVGSTLLSRLIDESGTVLPLREPAPLRTLAAAFDGASPGLERVLETMLRLWERGFEGTGMVLLKATSAAERLAPQLLTQRPQAKAVVLNVSAEAYLATMLAAPHPARDLNALGPERLNRLHRMNVKVARPKTLGELAAMSWLAEKLTQLELSAQFQARILCVDFDAMLQDLNGTLEAILQHLGIRGESRDAVLAASNKVLTRYSKAPNQTYSPELRRELLGEARKHFPREIQAALEWLEAHAKMHENVKAIL
jgi:hypothetical protein